MDEEGDELEEGEREEQDDFKTLVADDVIIRGSFLFSHNALLRTT